MDRIQPLSGGVGVWIAQMTWHGAMPKILAHIHVVSQLINLPKIWNTTGCDVNTQHLLGEALDPAHGAGHAGAVKLLCTMLLKSRILSRIAKYYL